MHPDPVINLLVLGHLNVAIYNAVCAQPQNCDGKILSHFLLFGMHWKQDCADRRIERLSVFMTQGRVLSASNS